MIPDQRIMTPAAPPSIACVHAPAFVLPFPAQETPALVRLLRRFSPDVEASPDSPGTFWLEAGGLRRLFGSPAEWAAKLRADLAAAGVRASVAVGFTRFGTYATARRKDRAAAEPPILFNDAEAEAVAARETSLADLDLPPNAQDSLDRLGVRTLGDFLRLPPDGLAERFGPEMIRLHRLASGRLWDPLRPLPPPVCRARRMVLDHPESSLDRVL